MTDGGREGLASLVVVLLYLGLCGLMVWGLTSIGVV